MVTALSVSMQTQKITKYVTGRVFTAVNKVIKQKKIIIIKHKEPS